MIGRNRYYKCFNFIFNSIAGLGYGGVKQQYFNATSQSQQNRKIFEGYGGHLTYHQELWILPLISMFNVDMSKSIINSRIRKNPNDEHLGLYEQARELATKEGKNGLRYPWEQADYGIEVSSLNDASKKIHVSGDISFGLRSYLRMTHSQDFLYQSISSDVSLRGEDYIYQLAKYWSDKFVYEESASAYGIKGSKMCQNVLFDITKIFKIINKNQESLLENFSNRVMLTMKRLQTLWHRYL